MDINTEREIELAFNEVCKKSSQILGQFGEELKTEQAVSMNK